MRKKNFASLQQTPIEKLKRFPVSHTHTHTPISRYELSQSSIEQTFPSAEAWSTLRWICSCHRQFVGCILCSNSSRTTRLSLSSWQTLFKAKKSSKNWMKKMHFSCFVVRSIINQIMARARFCDTFFTSAPRGEPLSLATKKRLNFRSSW